MFNLGVIVECKGNLTRDPDMRYLPDGSPVTNLSLAVNREWTNTSTGEKHSEVTWLRCDLWGTQAESANQHLEKGQQVIIRGRLKPDAQTGHPRIWNARDGRVGASFEVRVMNIDYGPRPNGSNADSAPAPQAAPAAAAVPFDDGIPF